MGRERIATGVAVSLALAAALMVLTEERHPTVVRAQSAIGGPIHGYVGAALFAELQIAAAAIQPAIVNVPDITVVARDVKTGVNSAPVTTNPQGYFRTGRLPPGVYHICVSGAGYSSSCDPEEISVVDSVHVMNHVVQIRPASGAIEGTVRLADQVTPCFWFRPAFSTVNVIQAQVSLLDKGGNVVAGPVKGNSVGQYVLPVAGVQGGFSVRAVCQALSSSPSVTYAGGVLQEDIIIRNNPPQIASLSLTKGGVGVRIANPGDVLQATVVAKDPDGDPLHYQWTDDSGRSLGLPDSPTVNWPLQNVSAQNTLRVQVSDGNGGFAVTQQSLSGGAQGVFFQGTLAGRVDGKPIANAAITLNGVATTSDAAGNFQVQVPNASRFVLNIGQPGFAPVSRVYYAPAAGMQIPLDATETVTVNARTGGAVQSSGDCECACEERHHDHHWDGHRWDHDWDHRGHDHDRDHKKKCKPSTGSPLGMTLEANSLIDAHGNPFTGTASVELFQYDTTLPNPIPGDQGATSQGKPVRLATFGAFYIQPRDSSGQPLQMAPNKKASVTMPIEPTLLAKAPATIPFLRYDESTGLWTEVGTLTRSGSNYVGTINHFSLFNADTEFAGSACVKVILDPDTFTSFPYALDGTYVDPSSGQFHHNGTQVSANPIGVERMPPNVDFTLDVYDSTNTTLLKSVTLNSGPPLAAAFSNNGYDTDSVNYSHCNGPVTIYDTNIPTGPAYLVPITGGAITDNSAAYAAGTEAGTTTSAKYTLAGWQSANGFTGSEVPTFYFNNGDLKFGRKMVCRVVNTSTGYTACYVQNFGNVGEDDAPLALSNARSGTSLQATVTMEYNPNPTNPGENVQFWAYDPSGNYLSHPTLDNQGGKPIPEICLGCHGGYFDSNNLVSGAIFLPFDLDSFLYDSLGDPHTVASAQTQFQQLNSIVLNTHPDTLTSDPNDPITNLMKLWYPPNGPTAGAQFVFNNAVAANQGGFPGTGPAQLYDNIVKPACRTCHTAQGSSIDWTSFTQMNTNATLIQQFACGNGTPLAPNTLNFAMPHGQVPFKLFWQNSLNTTLESDLNLPSPPGCPNQ